MASMVKERTKEKKKVKDKPKHRSTEEIKISQTTILSETSFTNTKNIFEDETKTTLTLQASIEKPEDVEIKQIATDSSNSNTNIECTNKNEDFIEDFALPSISHVYDVIDDMQKEPDIIEVEILKGVNDTSQTKELTKLEKEFQNKEFTSVVNNELLVNNIGENYLDLNKRLENMVIPKAVEITDERASEIENPNAYLGVNIMTDNLGLENIVSHSQESAQDMDIPLEDLLDLAEENIESQNSTALKSLEDATPSAPVLEENTQMPPKYTEIQEVSSEFKNKAPYMSIEEVLKIFGEKEMEEIRVLSEREEILVEEGPTSGPEHPLVDLLSTFRSSLNSMERLRIQLASNLTDEEKFRSKLWKIETRNINLTKKCSCGLFVDFKATYEHAELSKEKLPIAKLKLEGLLRDIQDSYCHHQHEAILTHFQIEELISETVQSNKLVIREALSLILEAMRHSDRDPEPLPSALERWAWALADALVDQRDIRHLLFLIHHLFRQSRSVMWAVDVIKLSVEDSVGAARLIAIMDILFAKSKVDAAVECNECDTEDVWEEVDKHGSGGAVSEGSLRERDMLALFFKFPLGELAAKLLLFNRIDFEQTQSADWARQGQGRDVLKACCGIRVLLATLTRIVTLHAHYGKLLCAIYGFTSKILLALSCLYFNSRNVCDEEMRNKVVTELEAVFVDGFHLFKQALPALPTTLLRPETARDYCTTFIAVLHEKSPRLIKSLSIETPPFDCMLCVDVIVKSAIHRTYDHELGRLVLEFIVKDLKRKNAQCKGGCVEAAYEWIPHLLTAHSHLQIHFLKMIAEINPVEPVDPVVVKRFTVRKWRVKPDEMRAVLDDWARRASPLLQHLLFVLDYTASRLLPLEVQVAIGSFLCEYVRSSASQGQEWCWEVLRKLRLHRIWWKVPLDAPPPDHQPTDLFTIAYTLLATSWGHCMPLICSQGVSALCLLAAVRPRDAIHCLAPIMIVMANSPESISLTPKFTELFTILLNSGPSLVQRAFGRRGMSGPELLLQLILKQLEGETCEGAPRGSILSAWMHALWRHSLPSTASSVLDMAAVACRDWPRLDAHATMLLQDENSKENILQAVRNSNTAPLLCECVLRACHACKETPIYARLLTAIAQQKANGQKIHVDNALQQIGANWSADELVIYRSATAAMTAPTNHPSHLALWRLFMHLYLQRPPDNILRSSLAMGPLFFSGIIKSRTLNQIKKRLQDIAAYHHNETKKFRTQQQAADELKSVTITTQPSEVSNDEVFPALTMKHLTGKTIELSSEPNSSEEETESESTDSKKESDISKDTSFHMMTYHEAAEKLFREYLMWLEEGEKVTALPHQADMARYIPEQAFEAGWRHALEISRPTSETPPSKPVKYSSSRLPSISLVTQSPLQVAIINVKSIKTRLRKSKPRIKVESSLRDVDFKDSRMLLSLVDKHLKNVEKLAMEWFTEVSRISSLDVKLWELVCSLRVRRPLPAIKKQCSNKCKPMTLLLNQDEWCISTAAERGIKENRSNVRACIRRLCSPRTSAARTVAALHTIARRIGVGVGASSVVERAWASGGACVACAPAHAAIADTVSHLAERWICHDGKLCADLLTRWSRHSKNTLQQSLCGVLISPQKLPYDQWPIVYMTLLRAELPQNMLFSYLSKFEMNRWSERADAASRRDILEALYTAVQRWGPNPKPQYHMLLELLGVHTKAVLNEVEICAHVTKCAKATVAAKLPRQYWTYVVNAAENVAGRVPFDQLGHVLRELGVMWWEARTGLKKTKSPTVYSLYSPYIARLLSALLRAFVDAALKLSYSPERVSLYAWSALQESWSAWIIPSDSAPPLLPSLADQEAFTSMLRHFVDAIHQIMLDCPGSEIRLLQQAFEWTIQTYMCLQSLHGSQENRVQMSALRAELDKLPWAEHQWCYWKCMQAVMQICRSTDKEMTSWCCRTSRNTKAETWLRDLDENIMYDQLAPKLATLLYLFTGTLMPHDQQTLEEATRLPWWRLPEPALDEAMERFFMVHHNPAVPYHELPQFRVMLFACELTVHPHTPVQFRIGGPSRLKRCRAVSQLVRAACTPTLAAHAAGHTNALLSTLTQLALILDSSSDEIEELLSRAIVIMCMEPAASALPVWERWVCSTSTRMVQACVSAASVLTSLEYFAAIADISVKTLLNNKDCGGWVEIIDRLGASPWGDPCALLRRGKLHAAYACAQRHNDADARNLFTELRVANVNFVENEAIVALWICYSCRIALQFSQENPMEMSDAVACVMQMLAAWANPPRRSILQVVAMQADNDRPTHNLRLLCRLGQCVLIPGNESLAREFESACGGPPGAMAALAPWGRAPSRDRLVRLAHMLYPQHDVYFKLEADLVPT